MPTELALPPYACIRQISLCRYLWLAQNGMVKLCWWACFHLVDKYNYQKGARWVVSEIGVLGHCWVSCYLESDQKVHHLLHCKHCASFGFIIRITLHDRIFWHKTENTVKTQQACLHLRWEGKDLKGTRRITFSHTGWWAYSMEWTVRGSCRWIAISI